ncbi:hypothetical protein [Serinibacter salmoneus]|uniref:Uncharacterized protein n=1 Tax=Serinibacter salmoneus TaxID=556530 RepID=A0A2A9D2R4_9MICO|nr:hypothetical protein [Serinibacter salmoneus]PFG20998.1 hypothetical protein ATL40_2617 [Serinibacter salmoneus]
MTGDGALVVGYTPEAQRWRQAKAKQNRKLWGVLATVLGAMFSAGSVLFFGIFALIGYGTGGLPAAGAGVMVGAGLTVAVGLAVLVLGIWLLARPARTPSTWAVRIEGDTVTFASEAANVFLLASHYRPQSSHPAAGLSISLREPIGVEGPGSRGLQQYAPYPVALDRLVFDGLPMQQYRNYPVGALDTHPDVIHAALMSASATAA